MKKKSQKFTSFVSRTQYVNYQDTSHIVSEFNHSVRLYKRFVVALNGGDDELAAKKLREAGTILFQVCEWSLKNYLHRRFAEMEKEGSMTSVLRERKTDNLQARTTNIGTLMGDFVEFSSPKHVKQRPKVGAVLDVKLLNEKYDEKKGKNIWMATMDIGNAPDMESDTSTDFASKIKALNLKFDAID